MNCKLTSFSEDKTKSGVIYKWNGEVIGERVADDSKEQFVRVVNEGSKHFKQLGLKAHSQNVDFLKLAKYVLENVEDSDKARGNMQLNYLFSGGANYNRMECDDHYGCAVPAINKGSQKWYELAVELRDIARKLGVPWSDEEQLKCEVLSIEAGCLQSQLTRRIYLKELQLHCSSFSQTLDELKSILMY